MLGLQNWVVTGDRTVFETLYAVPVNESTLLTIACIGDAPVAFFVEGNTIDYIRGDPIVDTMLNMESACRTHWGVSVPRFDGVISSRAPFGNSFFSAMEAGDGATSLVIWHDRNSLSLQIYLDKCCELLDMSMEEIAQMQQSKTAANFMAVLIQTK
ncbi:MAG: hypothetical protein IJF65_00010 [Clostridia bacterium]|nr:hypothetical protein [Clostridia bacterium]